MSGLFSSIWTWYVLNIIVDLIYVIKFRILTFLLFLYFHFLFADTRRYKIWIFRLRPHLHNCDHALFSFIHGWLHLFYTSYITQRMVLQSITQRSSFMEKSNTFCQSCFSSSRWMGSIGTVSFICIFYTHA